MASQNYTISHNSTGNQVYTLKDKAYGKIKDFDNVIGYAPKKSLNLDKLELTNKEKPKEELSLREMVRVSKGSIKQYIPTKWDDISRFGFRVFVDRFEKGYYKGQKGGGYPITKAMLKTLDSIKKSVMYKNNDFLIICDGKTGRGKTTLSFQLALYLDPNFNLSQVCFTPQQFMDVIQKAPKFTAIVLDEAMSLNSRNSMTADNKKINQLLSQIRSHNLFLIMNLPSAHDIDRSLFLSRCGMLIHCHSPSFGAKGYYKVYHENKNKMKTLYLLGKKMYSYNKPLPNFRGKFSSCFVLDEKPYNAKKDEATFSQQVTPIHSAFQERNIYIKHLKSMGLNYKDIEDLNPGGLSSNAIGKICRGDRGAIKNEEKEVINNG